MSIRRYAGDKIVGLSSDTKPVNVSDGATFYETDTLKEYIKNFGSWTRVANTNFTSPISVGEVSLGNTSITFGASGLSFSNGSSNSVFVSANGNVGIGTTTPSVKLHVAATTALTNSVQNMLLLDHTTTGLPADGFGSGILFRQSRTASGSPTDIASIVTDYAGSGTGAHPSLKFRVGYNQGDLEDAVEIYREQLGTTPTVMHFLRDDSEIRGVDNYITRDNTGSFRVGGQFAQLTAKTTWVPALSGYFGTAFHNSNAGTYPVEFDWQNSKATFVGLDVGIGTSSPLQKLDVAGNQYLRNGTTPTLFAAYNTYTDGSNYERGVFDWSTTSNVLRIGTEAAGTGTVRNIAFVGGNVGIGTTSPIAKLHIPAATGNKAIINLNATVTGSSSYGIEVGGYGRIGEWDLSSDKVININGGTILWGNYYGGDISFVTAAGTTGSMTERMRIADISGNIGIGTSSPAEKLDVVGNINSSNTVFAVHFDNVSDISLKDNISPLTNAKETINQLNPVSFNWKSSGEKSYGLIAQEVEQILPSIVHSKSDGTKTVNYIEIIAFLIAAVKDLQQQIDDINSK
jgi:hypothetical protein